MDSGDLNELLKARMALACARWRLTARQQNVLENLAHGESNKAIAQRLRCAEVTVEAHVTALLRSSGARSRGQLIARFWTMSPTDG
jgi:DNA-binding NarL/FixJ family response regulator